MPHIILLINLIKFAFPTLSSSPFFPLQVHQNCCCSRRWKNPRGRYVLHNQAEGRKVGSAQNCTFYGQCTPFCVNHLLHSVNEASALLDESKVYFTWCYNQDEG